MDGATDTLIMQALKEWESALDVIEDPIFIHDRDYRIVQCNKAYRDHAGVPYDQIIGRPYFEIFPKMEGPFHDCSRALNGLENDDNHEEIRVKETLFRSRAYIVNDRNGLYRYSVHLLEDITLQRKSEEKLRENEAFITAVLDNLPVGISVNTVEPSVAFTYMNDTFPRLYRTTREQLDRPDAFWETVYEDPVFREEIRRRIIDDVASGETERMYWTDVPITRTGEETTYITARNVPMPDKRHMISMVWDVTERKRFEERLREEKAFSESLIQNLPDIFFLIDRSGRLQRWNRKLSLLFGLPESTMSNLQVMQYVHEEDRPAIEQKIAEVFETGSGSTEARMLQPGGERTYALSGSRIETPLGIFLIGFGIDITKRKKSEAALERANRALQTLSAGNLALVKAQSEEDLLRRVTDVIVVKGGYTLSTVCYAENDPEKTIRSVMWAGNGEEHYCGDMHISWGENEAGNLPIGEAIRTAKTQICRDILHANAYQPWKEALVSRGLVSAIALPLTEGHKAFGALTIYSAHQDTFTEAEVQLLEELTGDLAYGIIAQRTHAEHERHAILMRQSLEQSIQAIAATLEARDPYTAGHQRRVTELSVAIASEIGLSPDTIEGIRFAAMIHDLRKIRIPAEILSKPGKLNDIEYMLIKTHPQAGYDILKEIRFPWPIADMILQHHEKIDGSGYPLGLAGDQILLEANHLRRRCRRGDEFPPPLPPGDGDRCRAGRDHRGAGQTLRPCRRRRLSEAFQRKKVCVHPGFITGCGGRRITIN